MKLANLHTISAKYSGHFFILRYDRTDPLAARKAANVLAKWVNDPTNSLTLETAKAILLAVLESTR